MCIRDSGSTESVGSTEEHREASRIIGKNREERRNTAVNTNVDRGKKAQGNASGNTGMKGNMQLNVTSNTDSNLEDKAMDTVAPQGAHTLELGATRAMAGIEPFALETLEFSLIKEELKQYCEMCIRDRNLKGK